MKTPILSAVALFGTLGILSVGYSAYISNYPTTATAGTSQLSAGEWNKMVSALQTLDGKLSTFTIAGGSVGIGTNPTGSFEVANGAVRNGYIAPGIWMNETDGLKSSYVVLDGGNLQFQRRGIGYGGYEGTPFYVKIDAPDSALTVNSNGFVGVGTSTPDRKFEVAGQVEATQPVPSGSLEGGFRLKGPADNSYSVIQFTNNAGNAHWSAITATPVGNIGIGTYSPSYTLQVNGSVAGTSWTATSDARMKKEVETLSGSLEKIAALRGVAFTWDRENNPERNFPEGRQIGFIAQEVEKIIPEVVTADDKGIKGVEYANITAELVEAVKELKIKNESLEREILALRNK